MALAFWFCNNYICKKNNMSRLIIKNIGPLKDVDINLKQINVFIGPQSSGKSTIAKIISFCQWLEKDLIIRQGLDHVDKSLIVRVLIKYHNMADYFSDRSEFHYYGHAIRLDYCDSKVEISRTEHFDTARVSKNTYIPAERNVIALPGIATLQWPQFYLRNFLFDWLNIRTKFGREDALQLRNLGVSYYFRENDRENILVMSDGKEIHLDQASSGLQSATPLYVLLNYMTKWIYTHDDDYSYEKYEKIRKGNSRRIELDEKTLAALIDAAEKGDIDNPLLQKLNRLKSAGKAEFSNIVIEEPEQNLFPLTQAGLIYDILAMIDHERDTLVVTTHSPFILYALNNCMLAYTVAGNIKQEENEAGPLELDFTEESWIDPNKVAVWELRDGYIENYDGTRNVTIQDENGLVRGNYFDRVMSNIMSDFNTLVTL